MLPDSFEVLAQFAGQTLVAAAITDTWEAARRKLTRLFGRGDPKKTELAERRLAETREQLAVADGSQQAQIRIYQSRVWQDRFADLLAEDPDIEEELRALVEEIQAHLPAAVASARDHSAAAGRDVLIRAEGGSAAAQVMGDVTLCKPPGNPQRPGRMGG